VVINDILDFSKIEAGKLELESVSFNIRDHMEETARALAFRANEKGLELVSNVHADVPEYVNGDAMRIRQILVNLVGNAIKFTECGEVELEARVEASDATQVVLHFVVKDTGIGIPKEKQAIIFEAFSQVDASTTRRYGGTGLGLTISASLVAAMQGRIWVESELGKGSQFHFTASLLRSNQCPASKVNYADLAGLSALVVDDNSTNRRILVDTLAVWGMEATPAAGAAEALEHLRTAAARGQSFGLVLTDVHMPGMDGFGLVKRIRDEPYLSKPIVLMLTSGEYAGDPARSRELGVAAYVVKPIRRAELRLAILRAVRERSGQPWEAAEVAPARRVRVEHPGPGCRILLAEDNIVNQRVALAILEKAGHIVRLACTGVQAIALMQEQTFDLVLMDIQMPEMDGLEATAAIRKMELRTGTYTPIIAMTAHAMTGDRERLIGAGMDDYISKPIAPVALLDLIDLHFHARAVGLKH
jgi:two-component system sensor histidine kinase/response regulator